MDNRSLLESYKKRIQIAESVYAGNNDGLKLDNYRKITLARCLRNTDA